MQISLQSGKWLQFELALIAAGRQSNVQGMGLEEAGIQLGERGLILVNENYQTRLPNIYAARDVVRFPALASTSMEQACTAVTHAFSFQYPGADVHIFPMAIYSVPEIDRVAGFSCGASGTGDLCSLAHRSTEGVAR